MICETLTINIKGNYGVKNYHIGEQVFHVSDCLWLRTLYIITHSSIV